MSDALNKEETQELIDANPHLGVIDRHAESVSKAKLVLILLCIVAIIASFIWTRLEVGDTNSRITKVESPCLRYGSQSKQCHESFQAAIDSITDYQLCVLLAKRPDLTNVAHPDCIRIARNQHRRGTDVIGQSTDAQAQHSPAESTGQPQRAPNPPGHSEHPPNPGSSETHGGGSPQAQAPPSPGSSPSPTPTAPQASPTPASGAAAAVEPSSSGGPASPPASSPSNPPVVGVEAPALPVHVCAPGVASVNC